MSKTDQTVIPAQRRYTYCDIVLDNCAMSVLGVKGVISKHKGFSMAVMNHIFCLYALGW